MKKEKKDKKKEETMKIKASDQSSKDLIHRVESIEINHRDLDFQLEKDAYNHF